MIGNSLGHYQITAVLGKGGMGEVWKASDTRLGREVALKTLPEAFARDADRLARLEREARMLAALNHPNIAAIYGLEEAGGTRFLVMEMVEGHTLAERVERGPLPLDEALLLARQIVDALEAAHEKDVVHRDLKPANIKVTPQGRLKVLDFGLAKALTGDAANVNLSQSPTLSLGVTQQGVILGTAAYMSPEQARGVTIDKRADLWAFGCILYEMLVGSSVFRGDTTSDVMASVLKSEPDYKALPPGTPPRLRRLLERCLQKDPRQRWHDAGDVRVELDQVGSDSRDLLEPAHVRSSGGGFRKLAWLAMGAGVALLAGWFALRHFTGPAPGPWGERLIEFTLEPPPGAIFDASLSQPFELAPNGSALAFVAIDAKGVPALWLRRFDSDTSQKLEGTEGAWAPFWSPESDWIGFYAPGALKRVSVSGGSPQKIVPITGADATTAAWGPGGTILFQSGRLETPFERVPFQGGTPTLATTFEPDEGAHRFAVFLENSHRFLYLAYTGRPGTHLHVGDLDGGPVKSLSWPAEALSSKIAYAPGYLLSVDKETIVVREFNEDTNTLSDARRLVEGIPVSGPSRAPFSVSRNGVLAYQQNGSGYDTVLRWVDRKGVPLSDAVATPRRYRGYAVTADGNRIAYSLIAPDGSAEVYVNERGRGEDRWSFHGDTADPVWSHDGKRLAFTGSIDLLIASAGHDAERLTSMTGKKTDLVYMPTSWGPKGDVLVYAAADLKASVDLYAFWLKDNRQERLSINSAFNEMGGVVSPDGEWLAYSTDRSGQPEVWIARFPSGEDATKVSVGGGTFPQWSGDGNELYYVAPDHRLMAVRMNLSVAGATSSAPVALFTLENVVGLFDSTTPYAVTGDGQRFLIGVLANTPQPPIHIVLNWPLLLGN
jgi:Tol biopolymer transport system component/predicted Ser/Thr protein kinase